MWQALFLQSNPDEHALPAEMVERARALPPEQRKAFLMPLDVVRMNYEPPKSSNSGQMLGGAGLFRPTPQMRFRQNLRAVRGPALVALRLLQEIGDERELELVRFLAEIEPRTPIGSEIKRAAEACLPFVAERAQRNAEARTLLRPAEAGTDTARMTHLRPAVAGDIISPAELLRAGQDDDAEKADESHDG